jgi:Ca-activated chloride channel family protein
MDMHLSTDRKLIRANGNSNRFVVARFVAPPSEQRRTRPPVNVAFVIDRSGSMGGQKIELAKQAVQTAVSLLKPADRFAIVTYDDMIEVVARSTVATAEAKRNATRALQDVDARGSTNLGEGWLRGCEQVAAINDERYISRVILLTDGLANQGITDHDELRRHASELRARGIMTTTIGLGEDFNEELLRGMSLAGGGNFYFVERASQILDTMTSELQETLDIVARSVTLTVTAPSILAVEALTDAIVERADQGWRLILGDAVAEQDFEVVLRINFPTGEIGREIAAQIVVDDRERIMRAASSLAWSYADTHSNDRQERNRAVDRLVAELYAGRARQEAVALNRERQYTKAVSALKGVAERILTYAGDDHDLLATVSSLKEESRAFAKEMGESSRKRAYYLSSNMMRMRTTDGKARKRLSGGS